MKAASMRTALAWVAACLALCMAPAGHALRCGSELVSKGEHQVEVERACGPPLRIDQRITYPYRLLSGQPFVVDVFEIPVLVEEWIYNFGAQRFMKLLRFENGRLVDIETLEKGY